jgi:membrane protein DedA with SNARE-associated domain
VAIAAIIGTMVGGTGGYWLGRWRGKSLLARYGHWLWLNERRVERAESYFRRHGMKTVFFGRYIVLLRIIGSLLAGVMRMPFLRFSIVNLAGGTTWAVTFTILGAGGDGVGDRGGDHILDTGQAAGDKLKAIGLIA